MPDPFVTDHQTLLQQYVDGRSLDARANLYAWQQPRHDLVAAALSYVPADARIVLDVGCGRGQYLAGLAGLQQDGIGIDLSPGMAAEARDRIGMPTIVGDANRLPVADDSVDATLALHLLNHLDEPVVALRECHRVTRSGGAVIVLTNSDDHIVEHRVLAGRAAGLPAPLESTDRSVAQDRALLDEVFDDVLIVSLDGTISVDRPQPLVDYADSAREFYERQVDGDWGEFLTEYERLVVDHIDRHGTLDITARTTIFVATVP